MKQTSVSMNDLSASWVNGIRAGESLKLDDHQIEGAMWLAERHRAGLFDPMGLGKTPTLIAALDKVGARRGIIVTTASTKENWRREMERWQTIPRRVKKGDDIFTLAAWLLGKIDVIILSYGIATRWRDRIYRETGIFDFIIMDEAHNIKTPTAQRTTAIRGENCDGLGGLAMYACHAWEATGTPIPNDPSDLWAFLRFCNATDLPRFLFLQHFFYQPDERKQRFRVRPDRQAELRELIMKVSLRRDIDVVNQPLRLTQSFINGDARAVTAYLRDHPGLDAVIIQALEDGNLAKIGSYGEHVMTVRRLIGEAKALPFAHYLIDQFKDTDAKGVVFGVHINALRLLESKLNAAKIETAYVDGSVSQNKRQKAIDAFQRDPKCQVFIGNIQAGGEGITLTAANKLWMFESGWTPKDNSQPIKRVHRRGQTRPCDADFVTLADSFDETIISIVRRKVQSIFEVTNQLILAAPDDQR